MTFRYLFVTLLVCLGFSCGLAVGAETAELDLSKLSTLREHVVKNTPETDDLRFKWVYEKLMYQAAGVSFGERVEVQMIKLQMMWELAHEQADAQVRGILQQALAAKNLGFLEKVILKWKLNPNHVHETGTLLDYILARRTFDEKGYQDDVSDDLIRMCRLKGARTKAELDAAIAPLRQRYDEVRHYAYGMAAVRKNGKWSFVDEFYQPILPCVFKTVSSFVHHGEARVTADGKKWICLDQGAHETKDLWER